MAEAKASAKESKPAKKEVKKSAPAPSASTSDWKERGFSSEAQWAKFARKLGM